MSGFKRYHDRVDGAILKVRPAQRRGTCLVLAVVLLGVAQDPVTEPQHVFEVSISLVSQILQPQYWTIALIREGSLQNPKDLEGQTGSVVNVLHQRVLAKICRSTNVVVLTWARMFCSLMSFCLSRLGVEVTTDRTSWPLFGTTHTKKTRSSNSFVTNLTNTNQDSKYQSRPVPRRGRAVSVPPLVLSDGAVLKLLHSGLQNLAGIVGKVQVSDLRQGHRHNSKGFLVLFGGTCADLFKEKKCFLFLF